MNGRDVILWLTAVIAVSFCAPPGVMIIVAGVAIARILLSAHW